MAILDGQFGVIGAGQMGTGIAQVAAQRGFEVVLSDASEDLATRARDRIAQALAKLVDKGKLAAPDRDAVLGRIRCAAGVEAFAGAGIVVEAVSENEDLKREIFRKLDRATPRTCILASNTSSISITRLASATSRPAQVVGMHFMNPVPLMQLVEVIRGAATSDETTRQVIALAEAMGKTVVTSRDFPGFIVNRVLMPLINEAIFALYEGVAKAEDIDLAMKLGTNHPMGPLALADLIGLDTTLAILEVLHRGLGDPKYRPCPLLVQYVDAGWLGRKTGRGFYAY
jgi:3-hydroxybutyryl-CoA dehydrogenase